jgi:hypothetical protein
MARAILRRLKNSNLPNYMRPADGRAFTLPSKPDAQLLRHSATPESADRKMIRMNLRIAKADDALGIFAALTVVAPEIPLLLDTNERQEAVATMISSWIALGESWVAMDDNGCVIGFLLVEPDRLERFHNNNLALHLCYAGVAKGERKAGVFRAMIEQLMSRKVSLTASVKAANQSDMAARLTQMGFQRSSTISRDEDNFRWQPRRTEPC